MPGKNSAFKPEKYGFFGRYILTNVPYAVMCAIIYIEVVGMGRIYFMVPEMTHTWENYILCTYWFVIDFVIFKGLNKTRNGDPGYMIPPDQTSKDRASKISPSSST